MFFEVSFLRNFDFRGLLFFYQYFIPTGLKKKLQQKDPTELIVGGTKQSKKRNLAGMTSILNHKQSQFHEVENLMVRSLGLPFFLYGTCK